jgi:uracil-DNA glycosylase
MRFVLAPSFSRGWSTILKPVLDAPFYHELQKFLRAEAAQGKIIFPAAENVFRALELLDLPEVKVVILGQDPYHGPGQAIGLSFAVPNELKRKPPSLKNIFKEVQSDLGVTLSPTESDLTGWLNQGVLLLNRVLTVESGHAFSHQGRGWEKFTDAVIDGLNARPKPVIFILWGAPAQKIKSRLDLNRHFVLESVHPSPLSAYRGFFGSRVFSKTNALLKKLGQAPIDWAKISVNTDE